MSDTPRTDRASHLCHPWTLPTDHEALSKFRLLANEMAKLERELAEKTRLLVEARDDVAELLSCIDAAIKEQSNVQTL